MREQAMEFMREFLTQASELACVEGAQGTVRILTCASRLMRHMHGSGPSPLTDELECVADYLAIRKARFGNRFHLAPFRADGLFVERMSAVGFLDEHLNAEALLADPEREYFIEFTRRLNVAQGVVLRMSIRSGAGGGRTYTRDLPL